MTHKISVSGPGNTKDGNCLIPLREQIEKYHSFQTFFDIGDAGFDETDNYHYCRKEGSIPVIDYNRRGEEKIRFFLKIVF